MHILVNQGLLERVVECTLLLIEAPVDVEARVVWTDVGRHLAVATAIEVRRSLHVVHHVKDRHLERMILRVLPFIVQCNHWLVVSRVQANASRYFQLLKLLKRSIDLQLLHSLMDLPSGFLVPLQGGHVLGRSRRPSINLVNGRKQ